MILKKESIFFLIVTILKVIYSYLPTILRNAIHSNDYSKVLYLLNSDKLQMVNTFVILTFYLVFLSCLIYSAIKKNTHSYVFIWITLFSYWLIIFIFESSSFLFLTQKSSNPRQLFVLSKLIRFSQYVSFFEVSLIEIN